MGAVILPLLLLYLLLMLWATGYGYRWAKKRGWGRKKCWLGAALGFLIVYLPLFWDWIPTVVAHRYYCEKEAGFWVYKTLEQWKAENPGVMETLVANKGAPSTRVGDMENFTDTYFLNKRVNKIVKQGRVFGLLPIRRLEQVLVDNGNSEVLAKYIDFSSSDAVWGGLKFWTHIQRCRIGANSKQDTYELRKQFSELEKQLSGREK